MKFKEIKIYLLQLGKFYQNNIIDNLFNNLNKSNRNVIKNKSF